MRQSPTFAEEKMLRQRAYHFIAGIDEAGRGPLAGPVVAAAVILPLDLSPTWLNQVRDSKKLSPALREFLFGRIGEVAIAIGIGTVAAQEIDSRGIGAAARLAMHLAVHQLSPPADFVLIDHFALPELNLPQKSITGGDNISLSIAAASIVAKVTRDRLMVEFDSCYPGYAFARNKGYPTREHISNLWRLGACPIHRRSFAPVREVVGAA